MPSSKRAALFLESAAAGFALPELPVQDLRVEEFEIPSHFGGSSCSKRRPPLSLSVPPLTLESQSDRRPASASTQPVDNVGKPCSGKDTAHCAESPAMSKPAGSVANSLGFNGKLRSRPSVDTAPKCSEPMLKTTGELESVDRKLSQEVLEPIGITIGQEVAPPLSPQAAASPPLQKSQQIFQGSAGLLQIIGSSEAHLCLEKTPTRTPTSSVRSLSGAQSPTKTHAVSGKQTRRPGTLATTAKLRPVRNRRKPSIFNCERNGDFVEPRPKPAKRGLASVAKTDPSPSNEVTKANSALEGVVPKKKKDSLKTLKLQSKRLNVRTKTKTRRKLARCKACGCAVCFSARKNNNHGCSAAPEVAKKWVDLNGGQHVQPSRSKVPLCIRCNATCWLQAGQANIVSPEVPHKAATDAKKQVDFSHPAQVHGLSFELPKRKRGRPSKQSIEERRRLLAAYLKAHPDASSHLAEEGVIESGKNCSKGPNIAAPVKRKLTAAKKKANKPRRSKKLRAEESSGAQGTEADCGDNVRQKSAPQRPKATGPRPGIVLGNFKFGIKHLLSSHQSILGLVDLRKLVSLNAFQQLTSEERLSLLPFLSEADLKSPDALTSLFNSATFTSNLYEFQHLLRHGYFEEPYQVQLRNRQRKIAKKRSKWKQRHFETYWGQNRSVGRADGSDHKAFLALERSFCDKHGLKFGLETAVTETSNFSVVHRDREAVRANLESEFAVVESARTTAEDTKSSSVPADPTKDDKGGALARASTADATSKASTGDVFATTVLNAVPMRGLGAQGEETPTSSQTAVGTKSSCANKQPVEQEKPTSCRREQREEDLKKMQIPSNPPGQPKQVVLQSADVALTSAQEACDSSTDGKVVGGTNAHVRNEPKTNPRRCCGVICEEAESFITKTDCAGTNVNERADAHADVQEVSSSTARNDCADVSVNTTGGAGPYVDEMDVSTLGDAAADANADGKIGAEKNGCTEQMSPDGGACEAVIIKKSIQATGDCCTFNSTQIHNKEPDTGESLAPEPCSTVDPVCLEAGNCGGNAGNGASSEDSILREDNNVKHQTAPSDLASQMTAANETLASQQSSDGHSTELKEILPNYAEPPSADMTSVVTDQNGVDLAVQTSSPHRPHDTSVLGKTTDESSSDGGKLRHTVDHAMEVAQTEASTGSAKRVSKTPPRPTSRPRRKTTATRVLNAALGLVEPEYVSIQRALNASRRQAQLDEKRRQRRAVLETGTVQRTTSCKLPARAENSGDDDSSDDSDDVVMFLEKAATSAALSDEHEQISATTTPSTTHTEASNVQREGDAFENVAVGTGQSDRKSSISSSHAVECATGSQSSLASVASSAVESVSRQFKPRLIQKTDALPRSTSDNGNNSFPATSELVHAETAARSSLLEQQGETNGGVEPGLDRVGFFNFPGKATVTKCKAAVSSESQVPYGVSSSSADPVQDRAHPGKANMVRLHQQQWFDGLTTRRFVDAGVFKNVAPPEQHLGSAAAANPMGIRHFLHQSNLGAVFGRTPSTGSALRSDSGQTATFLNSNHFASNDSSPGNTFAELANHLPVGEGLFSQPFGCVGRTSDASAFYNGNTHNVRLPFMRPVHEQSASHRQSSSDLHGVPQVLHHVAVPTPQWGIVPSLTPAQLRMQDALSDEQLRNMTADDLRYIVLQQLGPAQASSMSLQSLIKLQDTYLRLMHSMNYQQKQQM